MRYLIKLAISLITASLLIGCATRGFSDLEKTAAYENFIVQQKLERVSSITSFRLNGWRYLNSDYLILFSTLRKPYLIEITGGCTDLKFTHTIGINRSVSHRLEEKFDSVFTPSFPAIKCMIKSIHKISREQADELSEIGRGEKPEDKPGEEANQKKSSE